MIERCPICESSLKFTPWEQGDNRVTNPKVTCAVNCGFRYEVDPDKMTAHTPAGSNSWDHARLHGEKAEWVIRTRFKFEGLNA